MSSSDSNLLCSSTIFVKDIYQKYKNPNLTDRQTLIMTRTCNIMIGICAMLIAMMNISIVTLNLFAFAMRSAGPFAAYGLGLAMPNATKNSGIVSVFGSSRCVAGTWRAIWYISYRVWSSFRMHFFRINYGN